MGEFVLINAKFRFMNIKVTLLVILIKHKCYALYAYISSVCKYEIMNELTWSRIFAAQISAYREVSSIT